jgi:hypothetical protein
MDIQKTKGEYDHDIGYCGKYTQGEKGQSEQTCRGTSGRSET